MKLQQYVIFYCFRNYKRCTDKRSDGSNVSVYVTMIYCTQSAFYFTMAYNGDDPSGIMFVEVFAPGEKYVPAMEISAGYGGCNYPPDHIVCR